MILKNVKSVQTKTHLFDIEGSCGSLYVNDLLQFMNGEKYLVTEVKDGKFKAIPFYDAEQNMEEIVGDSVNVGVTALSTLKFNEYKNATGNIMYEGVKSNMLLLDEAGTMLHFKAPPIDNYNLIAPLLTFESEDDFYYLQILMRKKENPQLGSNSRVIKNYYIKSLEHLNSRYEEIKLLCRTHNARAMIRLNKRSFRKVAMRTMVNVANTLVNEEYKFIGKYYDRACGETHNEEANKKWILDFDNSPSALQIEKITKEIQQCKPEGDKVIEYIPSRAGGHIITKPFHLADFKLDHLLIGEDIHKDNPTNLYIP